MPSTAIEPRWIRYGASAAGKLTVTQEKSASGRMAWIVPVRVDMTEHHVAAKPPVRGHGALQVHERAWYAVSEARHLRGFGSDLRARTLGRRPCRRPSGRRRSPRRFRPGADRCEPSVVMRRRSRRRSAVTSAISPTDSINPVNIPFHEHIGTERRHAPIGQRRDRHRCRHRAMATPSPPSVHGATYRWTASTRPAVPGGRLQRDVPLRASAT